VLLNRRAYQAHTIPIALKADAVPMEVAIRASWNFIPVGGETELKRFKYVDDGVTGK